MPRRLRHAGLTACLLALATRALGEEGPRLTLELGGLQGPESLEAPLKLALLATAVGLAPALAVMATSFTRLIIVLHFVRQALGTQSMPPNQVLAGLALFLTFFVMMPVAAQINDAALTPYQAGELDAAAALQQAQHPVKEFMLRQTRDQDLTLFLDLAALQAPATREATPLRAVLPAFVLSEIKTAFQIGFVLFLPFLIIDLVVASVLVSMGMIMLPPVVVSFPFKVLLFVLADGWSLVIGSTIRSFLS